MVATPDIHDANDDQEHHYKRTFMSEEAPARPFWNGRRLLGSRSIPIWTCHGSCKR
jgi:hypothetical protein